MKKSVLFLMSAALLLSSNVMAQGQQIPNGDFETWTFDGENLPDNCNSFQTATGTWAGMGYNPKDRQVKRSTDIRPGSNGQYSCSIWSRFVLIANAQGNLTSGRVSAGSTKPADATNFNYTDRNGAAKANAKVGEPCAIPFTSKPTAVKVWVKYLQGGQTEDYGEHATAKFSAIIHDDADYISYGLPENDTPENKALVVASAVKEINYNGGEWEELIIPFKYTNNDAKPAYIQINASTNAYPGAGLAGDYLYIDDIEMYYNEEKDVKVFANDALYVTINDEENGPLDATVFVKENGDNTINFSMKNFVISLYGQEVGVGNIEVNNIPVTVNKGITSFTANQTIEIAAGDDPTVDYWMGPLIGEIPLNMTGKYDNDHLYVTIDIDMSESPLGQIIKVKLGNEGDVTTVASVKVSEKNAASGVIYDLNGRKVSEMQRGRFYIVDGKIVMN